MLQNAGPGELCLGVEARRSAAYSSSEASTPGCTTSAGKKYHRSLGPLPLKQLWFFICAHQLVKSNVNDTHWLLGSEKNTPIVYKAFSQASWKADNSALAPLDNRRAKTSDFMVTAALSDREGNPSPPTTEEKSLCPCPLVGGDDGGSVEKWDNWKRFAFDFAMSSSDSSSWVCDSKSDLTADLGQDT